jgi:hypothetical protein
MGDWIDDLLANQINDEGIWDNFMDEFHYQFGDTQSVTRARQALKTHRMIWPHIDAYIREFEELVRKAEYDTHHDETLEYFVEGLPRSVKEVVFLPPCREATKRPSRRPSTPPRQLRC